MQIGHQRDFLNKLIDDILSIAMDERPDCTLDID